MRDIYFNDSSYQMGICFVLEIIRRIVPMLDLAMVVQILNTLMCVLMSGMMALLAREMGGEKRRAAVCAMYLLFLPMPYLNSMTNSRYYD